MTGPVLIPMHPAGDPSSRGWGAGWPRCQTATWQKVTWSNGASPAGGVRREIARLVELLGNATIRGGYVLRAGQCWGGECRVITGTTNQPSLHSWALAVDLNAPENPYQPNDGTIVHDIPASVVALWATYGFRNGITYTGGHVDPMHMEFMGTPGEAAVMTALASVALVPHHPIPFPGVGHFRLGRSSLLAGFLNSALRRHGYHPDAGTLFGTSTLVAVRAFQHAQGWTGSGADGYPGPLTWARLGVTS